MTVANTRTGHRLERKTFHTSRSLDFCNEKGLITETGHQPEVWPLVAVKELIDNALDAAEEADTPPEIKVKVDNTGITITDNGPGIPTSTVKGILDYAIRVSSREAYVAPDRGAQGNALKTLIAMPFVLDGEHGTVEVISQGVRHQISFTADHVRQQPDIGHVEHEAHQKNGTEFQLHWPDSACSILHDAKDRFLQIVDDYTWLNPHLAVAVDWFGMKVNSPATDPAWRKWGPSDPTSAHWYRPDHLERLIGAKIAADTDAGADNGRTVREFISEFRGLSGSAKQKKVLDATGLRREPLSSFADGGEIKHELVARLLVAMQEHTKPVKPPTLGVIGKEHLQQRFAALNVEMESFDYRKVSDIDDGVPWMVETAFGWCPDGDSRRLITGVNWSPGIINPFRQLGTYGESLDTILTEQRAKQTEPVILFLHMACPRVEYTDRGKSNVVIK